ncbi:hypothetical protein IT575_05625 [bacterium]|nr:hypothetical protein [bacterium]
MRNTRFGLAGLVLALLLLCSGCFDVNEDVTVRSDLSGIYALKLTMPERLAAMGEMLPGEHSGGDPERNFEELKSRLEQEKFIESATVSSATEGSVRFYSIEIRARDMRKLSEYFAAQTEAETGGPFKLSYKLERQGFGKFRFTRELNFNAMEGMGMPDVGAGGAAEEGDTAESAASEGTQADASAAQTDSSAEGVRSLKDKVLDQGRDALSQGIDQGIEQGRKALGGLGGLLGGLMGDALLSEHYYTVRFYANGIESNDAAPLPDGKGVEWRIPMSELAGPGAAPRTLSADFKAIGISGAAMLMLTLLVMFLTAGLVIGIAVTGARRRRRAADSKPAA